MNNYNNINSIEKFQMDSLLRILKSDKFRSDLDQIEHFIQSQYEELHFMWGIKNKLKLAAERLVRFHIWKNYALTDLYQTPLSSDVAFVLNDCIMNIDCKTIDSAGNKNDRTFIQFEPNQANFNNIPLFSTQIQLPNGSSICFDGFEFHPQLEKFHKNKPVLSYFVFINYRDDGDSFSIEGIELCCIPHNKIVEEEFESNIISGFKTYRYLKKLQAEKINNNLVPQKEPRSNWVKFRKAKRYYDSSGMHPFNNKKLLIWGWESKNWNVCLGGHTTRVRKDKIKKRHTEEGTEWNGWEIIN